MAPLKPTSVLKSAKGLQLPVVGLGTWQAKDSEVEASLNTALEAGYRLIDTANRYCNEHVIGKVLKQWFDSGRLKREDIFITTKLPFFGNQPDKVKPYLLASLKDLQLDYVDLYLIHNPCGIVETEALKRGDISEMIVDKTTDLEALWKAMEKQVDDGLTKFVGISNFNTKQIERIVKVARIPPANLQIELYLYQQGAAERALCAKHGIAVTSFSTLGSAASPASFANCLDNPLEDPVVKKIAAAHKKSPGQVLLRHALQLGIAIIPKSVNPERIRQNIQLFDFELTAAEMKELNSLDRGEAGRRFFLKIFLGHPEFPYPVPPNKQ